MAESSDASAFQMVMTIATAFALWGSDMYVLVGPEYQVTGCRIEECHEPDWKSD